mgnify:CR=1 FL=1
MERGLLYWRAAGDRDGKRWNCDRDRGSYPGADVLNREQAQELLLSPLASKGSKVPSEIWKNIHPTGSRFRCTVRRQTNFRQ